MAHTVVHIYDMSVEALPKPQHNIPQDAKLFVQLVISDNIVLQTDMVDKIPEKYLWEFSINSKLSFEANSFSVIIIQMHPVKGLHLLGIAKFNKEDIYALTWAEDLTQVMVNIHTTNEVPLKLMIGLSQSPLNSNPSFHHINMDLDKIGGLSSEIIYSDLDPMLQSIKDGEEVKTHDIFLMHERILLLPSTSDKKASFLHTMGKIYLECWEATQVITDLHQAISVFHATVQHCLHDDPARGKYLGSYANSLFSRFEELDSMEDLDEAILKEKEAEQLASDDHANKAQRLHSLGNSLLTRFERLGQMTDLHAAILKEEEAVQIASDEDSNKPAYLSGLGQSLVCQFEQSGKSSDLDQAILQFQKAVDLTADDNPDQAIWINNLGNALVAHFEATHIASDINQAVLYLEKALELTSEDDPALSSRLSNLGIALSSQFECSGSMEDLDSAVEKSEKAVQLCSENDSDRPLWLYNLACSLSTRFDYLGHFHDIDQSVKHFQEAINLTPRDHPLIVERLQNLTFSLITRFEYFGNSTDIDQSVSAIKEAIHLTSDSPSEKAECLHGLGVALYHQFQQNGKVEVIDQAVSKALEASALTSKDHPNRSSHLAGLSHSLLCRFEHFGVLSDVNQSISSLEEALHNKSLTAQKRASYLNSLSSAYLCRFRHLGDLSDLSESVSSSRAAVDFTPNNSIYKAIRLTNLGSCLLCSFEQDGRVQDLNDSISSFEKALDLASGNALYRSSQLEYLGIALICHYQSTKNPTDLKDALEKLQEAVKLTPHDHPSLPMKLNDLSNVFYQIFIHSHDPDDLRKSVLKSKEAIQLCSDQDPSKSSFLTNLAEALVLQHKYSNDPQNSLEEVVLQYSLAASCTASPSFIRLHASLKWIAYAQILSHKSIWDACKTALHLLPQAAWLGLPISNRYQMITELAGTIVRDAIWTAIDGKKYTDAVEWFEQGRAVVWGQLLQLRMPIDELRNAYPDIAQQLMQMSRILENNNNDISARVTRNISPNFQPVSPQYHQLAFERDKLISEIQKLPNFEQFLLPKPFAQLTTAAHSGPVIIINMGSYSCDALAIMPGIDSSSDDAVVHITLKFTLSDAQKLRKSLSDILQYGSARSSDQMRPTKAQMKSRLDIEEDDDLQDASNHMDPEGTLAEILSVLWTDVVKPILDGLNIKNPSQDISDLPHVWWCPTGPLAFLPVHAAGVYGTEEQLGSKLSDYVISSYTPTLTTLINSSHSKMQVQPPPQLLTVALPSESRLPGTRKEHEIIGQYRKFIPIQQLFEDQATAANVKKAMLNYGWVHFACHGTQEISNPTSSALKLAGNSELRLSEIIELNLPYAKLAFLSACQTATGDESLQEEAVHLAAGMLLAGYQGVIATMWAIEDQDAPEVADSVYGHLLSKSPPDSTKAAAALQLAIQKLRKRGASLLSWVPFIHMGA